VTPANDHKSRSLVRSRTLSNHAAIRFLRLCVTDSVAIGSQLDEPARERTASEFASLYEQAGFELEHIIPTPSPLRIIIGKLRA